jgi:hypothetical protein
LRLDTRLDAYCAYLTLWPLQELIRRRESGRLDTGESRAQESRVESSAV